MTEFKPFQKITHLNKAQMQITQKINGSNAQVVISLDPETGTHDVRAGSRTRWIYPEDDNYGFAGFVARNRQEFIDKLGVGTHFGEWCGPGINSGEGLSEKTFVLFDFWRYAPEQPLPPGCKLVPCLYTGALDPVKIDAVMLDLKQNGSRLVPGYMSPEGIVVQIAGARYKKVFLPEETKWTGGPRIKAETGPEPDYSYLLQPVRLEKLWSRDEKYALLYPQSLPDLVRDYFQDLIVEGQIEGDEDRIRAVRKGASSEVYGFIKMMVNNGMKGSI